MTTLNPLDALADKLRALPGDAMDRYATRRALDGADLAATLARTTAHAPHAWRAVVADTFNALCQSAPAPIPGAPLAGIMRDVLAAPATATLRETTAGDRDAAALATAKMCETLADRLPTDPDKRAAAIRRATRAAQAEVDATIDAAGVLQGRGGGSNGRSDLAHVARLMKAAQSKIARIIKLAGRMQSEARARMARQVHGAPEEIVGMTLGRDLARALPIEMAKLGHASLKLDVLRRYALGQVSTYEQRGAAPAARGPIVVCVDSSGSMRGEPEVWAKAVALGLLALARDQRRDFAIIHFSDAWRVDVCDLGRTPDMPAILAALAPFHDGGTDFVAPLGRALDVIESRAEMKRADIVFITDGAAEIDDVDVQAINARKAARGVRVWTVAMGMREGMIPATAGIRRVSNEMACVPDLTSDGDALDVAFDGIGAT